MTTTTKLYWLPVADPRHTEVLGYRCTTPTGRNLYRQLDWKNWWMDGPEPHLFNPGGYYFHVRTKHKDPDERVTYRVRCWYAGGKYRGRPVTDANLRHLYDHLAHGRVGGVKAQQAQAKALLAPAIEMLERLTTPQPGSAWHEDDGSVLWWSLPVCEPPYCGSPLCDDWPFDGDDGSVLWWTPLVIPRQRA